MSQRQIVAELWDSYVRKVMPPNAPTVQRWETRRAFYAGCESLLRAIMHAMEAGSDATDGDLAVMGGIEMELQKFARDIKEGRA